MSPVLHSHLAPEVTPQIGEPTLAGENPDLTADYIFCNNLWVKNVLIQGNAPGTVIAPADRLWARAIRNTSATVPSNPTGTSTLLLDNGWVVENSNWTSDATRNGDSTLNVISAGIQLPVNFRGFIQIAVGFQTSAWSGSAVINTFQAWSISMQARFPGGFVYVRDTLRTIIATKTSGTYNYFWFTDCWTPASVVPMGLEIWNLDTNGQFNINAVTLEVVLFPLKVIQ